MKTKNNNNFYLDMLDEVYRSYDFFNKTFAKGTLPHPAITITRTQMKNTNGWFCGNTFEKLSGEKAHEIRLCPDVLRGGVDEFLEVLIHEMVHLFNKVKGVSDCTRTQYHNEHFKKAAIEFGLDVSKYKNKGWAVTRLGKLATAAIKKLQPKTELYSIYLNHQSNEEKDKTKKPPKYNNRIPADDATVEVVDEGIEIDPNSSSRAEFVKNAVEMYTKYLKGEILVSEPSKVEAKIIATQKKSKKSKEDLNHLINIRVGSDKIAPAKLVWRKNGKGN